MLGGGGGYFWVLRRSTFAAAISIGLEMEKRVFCDRRVKLIYEEAKTTSLCPLDQSIQFPWLYVAFKTTLSSVSSSHLFRRSRRQNNNFSPEASTSPLTQF